MSATLALLREVIDHELVDADGVSCGMVDDILFEEGPGNVPAAAWLVVGPGGWKNRLPALLIVILGWLHATRTVRVPWAEVDEVSEVVRLRKTAAALGLGILDRRVGRWLAKLPGS